LADSKISDLTNYTTPLDADVIPIVDVSNGITKKMPISAIFPTSSTDNAIIRFDGITGKLLQNSSLMITDIIGGSIGIHPAAKSGVGTSVGYEAGASTDDNGGDAGVTGGAATGGNKVGGTGGVYGGAGFGSGAGGLAQTEGGDAGATGVGGIARVLGGQGGAVSGAGGDADILGGFAIAGNSNGGGVNIAPGNKTGAGAVGTINLKYYDGIANFATLDLSLIAASSKTFTFPNLTGTFVVASAVNTVNPTSPNRTLTINVGGTLYYISAKTTND